LGITKNPTTMAYCPCRLNVALAASPTMVETKNKI